MNRLVTLSDLGYVNRGRSKHRPRNAPELYGGQYPFVQTADIKHAGLYLNEYGQTYSQKGLEQSRLWPAGTLCITIAANIADTAILGCDACFPDSVIGFIPDDKKCDVRYVKYLFDTQLQTALKQLSQGVAQDNLSKDKLLSIKFCVPDLPVQRRIADVLSAYDDLIENNRRRIAILEEMARLAYRKWFGGANTARTATLGEICQAFGGGTPKTTSPEFWDGDIPWVVPTDITRNTCLALLDTERKITALGLQKSSAKMLPANAILMTSRASVGYFGMADFPVCTNQGFISIVPNNDSWRWYLLFNLMLRVEEIRSNAKGSTFPEISRARFRSMDVVIPDDNALIEFNRAVEPLMQQVWILAKQSAALAAARDMLLPRMMKGESATQLKCNQKKRNK